MGTTYKLTRNQDMIKILQGKMSDLPKQDDSSFYLWAGESTRVSEDENCAIKFPEKAKSSNSIKSQEFLIKTNRNFWKKMYLRESQNYQNRCHQIDRGCKLYKCDHCVMRRTSYDHDDDDQKVQEL